MDLQQLEQDVRAGRIKPARLVAWLGQQQEKLTEAQGQLAEARSQLAEAQQRIQTLETTVEALQQQVASSPTAKLDEPYSVKAEEQRQAARGRKARKKKHQPRRRGRVSTAEKLALAQEEEDVFPEGLGPQQCWLSHSRPVWRLREGRAVLVAYHVYRGPGNRYGQIPGALGRSEFGLEIIVAMGFLVYVAGLSFDKVCLVMNFFQGLTLRKSQVDALLHQLARHWEREFDRLCTLLAHSAVVHADETSWSLHSVWAFLSEKARLVFYGVHKDAATLRQILDAATFAGLLISDDAAVYAPFSRAQKCWAHLLRKAIKLTLECPDDADYRHLADELLEIYRAACRVQRDGRLSPAGRARKVEDLKDRVLALCGPVWWADLPPGEGPADQYRLLCNELMRLLQTKQLFTFVTAEAVQTPSGETHAVPGTNNAAEQALRNPAQARVTGRTNKTPRGARRQTVLSSVLESLRQYLPRYTLVSVVEEVGRWSRRGRSCFAELLSKLGLTCPDKSILDSLLPVPAD
jgi:transposase